MKSAMKYKPLPNYRYNNTILYHGDIISFTVIHYDNGITEYIFDNALSDNDKQSIIDRVTMLPFVY